MSASDSPAARATARYSRLTRRHGKQSGRPANDRTGRQDADPAGPPSPRNPRPPQRPPRNLGLSDHGAPRDLKPNGHQTAQDPNGHQTAQDPNGQQPAQDPNGQQPAQDQNGRQAAARGPRGPARRRSRGMSLRARMLVMLVGVTTVLLLIMGTVSTYLMARRVDGQLATIGRHLAGVAAVLQDQPYSARGAKHAGYAVVEVPVGTRSPLAVQSLTNGTLTTQLAAAIAQQLGSARLGPVQNLAVRGHQDQAKARLVSHGCGQFPSVNCGPFDISPNIEVVSRWVPATVSGTQTPIPGGPAILLVAEGIGSVRDQVRGFLVAELITGAALIALLAVAGEWLIGRGLEPLDQMTRTANDITTRGDLTARMPDSDDQTEVGRLGSSINTMLDRIQQAFSSRLRSEQKVREFAADASHELRTPLTTIRGYAELYRQGALGPDELPNAMRRIEQEADRMSTLVAELLELARLDRTSSLDLAETDLAGVVRDAVADAIAVEPQRPVRAEAPPRLVAVVDEPRIRQVLANLLGNVRAHTPVHTPVAVRLGVITGGVLIEVADAGPGMSTQDAVRAFDRFHRAADAGAGWEYQDHNQDGNVAAAASAPRLTAADDEPGQEPPDLRNGSPGGSGRAERTSGAGLGLSIVQAIANAHGGRATLESYLGQGTKVRVWLPVRTVP